MTEGNIKSIQERIKQLGIQPAQFSPNLNKSTFEPKNVPITQKTKPIPPPRGKSRLEVRTLPKPPTKFQKTNVTNTPTETQKTAENINVERSSFKRSPVPPIPKPEIQTNTSLDAPNNERPKLSPRPRQKQLPPPPPARGNVRMTQSFVEPDFSRRKPNRAPPPVPTSPSLRLSRTSSDSKEETKFVLFSPEMDDLTDEGDTSTDTSDTKENNESENDMEQQMFTKKYAVPTSTQVKSAITMQKWVRRWLAKRQLKKLKKNDYHRQKCANEILETERKYVSDLKIMKEVFLDPLKKMAEEPKPIITKDQISRIFSDIEVIIRVNTKFLENLEEKLSNFDRTKTTIGDVFLDFAPYFKTYMRYCNNYDRAMETLKQCKMNQRFKEEMTKMDKDDRTNKLGLPSYLITPIQRIPRYRLLLQDYIKHTNVEHPEYNVLQQALDRICDVANHLNEAVRTIEASQTILQLQEQFTTDIVLLEAHRRFLHYVRFSLVEGQNQLKPIHLHLFNDILVYSFGSPGRFEYKGKLELINTLLYDCVGDEKDNCKFQIIVPQVEKLTLVAPNPTEKREWMIKMFKAIRKIKSDKKEVSVSSTKPIQDDSSTTFNVAIQTDRDINVTPEEAIKVMKEGSNMLKYCRNARPHFRRFVLSQDESTLLWGSPKKKTSESSVPLREVKKILLGQKTAIFMRYKNPDIESLSFSLLYKDRTLDIVCKDKREYITWVTGISYLLSNLNERPNSTDTNTIPAHYDVPGVHDARLESKKFQEDYSRIGDAYSWGQGSRGALGHGNQDDVKQPLVMRDFLYLDVDKMACSNSASACILTTGQLFTWGANDCGRLGHEDEIDRLKPTLITSLQDHKIVDATLGHTHTMALEDNGTIWVFGGNEHGQLGLGINDKKRLTPTRLNFFRGKKIKQIAAGPWHSAVVTEDGELYTWGKGEDGQLGHGDKQNRNVPTLVQSLAGKQVVQVALGLWHTLALVKNGQVHSVYSWGNASYGQLGHGNTDEVLVPKLVEELKNKNVIEVAAGSTHSGCIIYSGAVYMWGNGIYGQIGNGKKKHSYKPTLVVDLVNEKAIQLACGLNHVFALTASGKVYAWGAGTYGRLGLGTETDEFKPQVIPLLEGKTVRKIAAGGSQGCAVCAHQWVPDKDSKVCMNCNAKFTMIRRRHHCRNCGGLFCGACSSKRIILLRYGFNDPVRVCDKCFQILSTTQKGGL